MFKKAERKQVKLKIAIAGPSGSGKTLSALLMAKGIGKRIALIDTENESASLYAGMKLPNGEEVPEFDTLSLDPPFTVDRYVMAMNAAVQAGYDVLIVDSLSHQWNGEGGTLSKKEQLDARGGNSYTNWAKLTPEHEKFKAAILHSDIHVLGTLRSKQEYALVGDDKGKNKVQKLGMAPVQRDGMEYEFTVFFDMDMRHQAEASKDRTGLFDGRLFVPSAKTGQELMQWLSGGVAAAPRQVQAPAPAQQPAQQPRPAAVAPIRPAQQQQPAQAPAQPPVNELAQPTEMVCEICQSKMLFSAKSQGHYCPNFKDQSNGRHSYVKPSEVAEFQARAAARAATLSAPAQDDVPPVEQLAGGVEQIPTWQQDLYGDPRMVK